MTPLEPTYCEARYQSDISNAAHGLGCVEMAVACDLSKKEDGPLPSERVRKNRLASDPKDPIGVFLY